MDLVLELFDEHLLDRLYANLIPLSAFTDPPIPSTSPPATLDTAVSAWTTVLRKLPHPSIPSSIPSSISSAHGLSAWPRDYIPRQLLSLTALTVIGIMLLYFIFATASYYFIFNHDMMRHPRFLKNQVRLEIESSMRAFPAITFLTVPWFMAEVHGYSKMYDDISDYGWTYLVLSVPLYLLFTDYCIYWIHRGLHVPLIYKNIHKPHHKWLIPTPFASHAFHPIDGYFQSIPYHLFIFIFPLQRYLYLVLFVLVNFWSIFIHDSDMVSGTGLEHIINGPAHHTLHHLYFTVNYGQYFTWADKVGGSFREPQPELDPLLEVKALENQKRKGGKAE
ncbi:c-5 sterol desaturase [Tulasnella sp. 419]|nr:c-5 sterol desaturase [Tulasnella sp. 419]